MSIINEALKKSGQPILTEIKEAKKKPAANWGPLFVIAVLGVITAPILMPLLHNPYRNEGQTHQMAVGPDLSRPNLKKQFGIEEAALPQNHMMPRFMMSGLVYSPDNSYCLINGKVVKLGESVGGAKLLKVTPSGAVLDYRGQEITLPANV